MINTLYRSILLFLATFSAAYASNIPYDQATFNQLLQAGKPVVLHFHADWCPTCRAQQKVLDELMPLPAYKDLPVLRVNFDKEQTLRRSYKVRNQSTFVMFNHGREIARSTGETDRDVIAELLKKAQ